MTPIPKFLKLDPVLFRRLPTLRKAAVGLAAYWEWRPQASLLEAADVLGIPESTARRWAAWLEELGATGGATRGAPSSMQVDIRGGEGESNGAPAPLVSQVQGETAHDAAVILATAYMVRTTRRSVTTSETYARILEDLRSKAYAARDLAVYLDATPHTEAYPRDLARTVTMYLEHLNLGRAEARRQTAWIALRRRLRNVSPGDTAWPTDEARAPPWTVIEVDAEAGCLVVRLRTPLDQLYASINGRVGGIWAERAHLARGQYRVEDRTLAGPDDLVAWTFEAETMPLFAAGTAETAKDAANTKGD